MQQTLVILILLLASGYAAWRIYKALSTPTDPCAGCPGCDLKKMKDREKCPK